jgi:hypothetical protein
MSSIILQTYVNTEVAKLDAKIASLTTQLAAKQAELDAYKASHPDVTPPPPPPPPPPPVNTGWPDATNTGVPAGTVLTAYTGPMTITAAGVTIDAKIITGSLRVTGANFVMKRSKQTYGGSWGVDAEGALNPTIQDCTITGPGAAGDANSGILGAGTFLRNNVSGSENGITLNDGASTIKGNYIHGLDNIKGPDLGHYDCISVQGGQNGVLIEDNTLVARDTSHVIIADDARDSTGKAMPITNVTINHNQMLGDSKFGVPSYNVYSVSRNGGAVTGIKITSNRIQKGANGYFDIVNSGTTQSGNVDLAGNPIVTG